MWKMYIAGSQYIATFAFGWIKSWITTQTPACWAQPVPPARILKHHPIHHWQNMSYPQPLAFRWDCLQKTTPVLHVPELCLLLSGLNISWPFSLCLRFLRSAEGLGKLPSASPRSVSVSWNKKEIGIIWVWSEWSQEWALLNNKKPNFHPAHKYRDQSQGFRKHYLFIAQKRPPFNLISFQERREELFLKEDHPEKTQKTQGILWVAAYIAYHLLQIYLLTRKLDPLWQ